MHTYHLKRNHQGCIDINVDECYFLIGGVHYGTKYVLKLSIDSFGGYFIPVYPLGFFDLCRSGIFLFTYLSFCFLYFYGGMGSGRNSYYCFLVYGGKYKPLTIRQFLIS